MWTLTLWQSVLVDKDYPLQIKQLFSRARRRDCFQAAVHTLEYSHVDATRHGGRSGRSLWRLNGLGQDGHRHARGLAQPEPGTRLSLSAGPRLYPMVWVSVRLPLLPRGSFYIEDRIRPTFGERLLWRIRYPF